MKKFLLIAIASLGMSLSAMAQDIIVLKNSNEIQAKIQSIGHNDITYLKCDNINGPSYTLSKSEIFFIKYANGQKDTFANMETYQSASLRPTQAKRNYQEDYSKAKFQGYSYLGADFASGFGGPSLDFSFGVRTSKYFYIGGGVGWHNLIGTMYYRYYDDYYDYYYYSEYTAWMPYLTFTSDLKAYIPTRGHFCPRLDLSFGGCVDAIDALAGFYMSFGAGFDYRRFSFGIGYQMPVIADEILALGYVRLGVRFGKK